MELKDILNQLKSENGLTTDRLSQLSGVPKGTLNKLLNGETRNPRGDTLRRIAAALNCSAEVFYGGEYTPALHALRNRDDILPITRRSIPMPGEIAAGRPLYMDEQHEIITCSDSINGDFALKVRGDSMIGARIHDGDIVFIRQQDDVEEGEIAAVILDDAITLKRVFHIKNGLQLLSMNDKYPPMIFTFDECDCIRIVGKAVGFQSSL